MLSKAEQHFYDRGQYGRIANQVDLCMEVSSRGCKGPPLERMVDDCGDEFAHDCDEDVDCWRHRKVTQIVARYLDAKRSKR